MMELEITWVVETGIPKWAAPYDDRRGGGLGGEPVDRLELHHPVAHRVHDPPAADGGAEGDRGRRDDDDPQRDVDASAMTPAANRARVMMPIVFCASLEPWAKAMKPADTTWSRRNTRRQRLAACAPEDPVQARPSARSATEEAEDGRGHQRHEHLVADPCEVERRRTPAATMVAPSSPPMSAWLLELGRPSHQVIRFQTIAPISAAATIGLASCVCSSTRPAPIVLATAVPANAPMKLNAVGHQRSRGCGRRARVATDVAIALAVSWKPLM